MKKYQWVLSVLVLVISTLVGSVWYYGLIRAIVTFLAWNGNAPSPLLQVDVNRLYVPSAGGTVFLQTDHYFPRGSDLNKPIFPTVMIRTPYGIDFHQQLGIMGQLNAYYLASQGYNVILQNCRGRFNSSGEYSPMRFETEDGFATMSWIKDQPWFNGKLGTAGVSYLGFTQYAVFGKDAPIQLSAAVPVLTSPFFYSNTHRKDAPILDVIFQWNFMMDLSHTVNPRFPEDIMKMRDYDNQFGKVRHNASLHFPLHEADALFYGKNVTHFRDILTHFKEDEPYWVARDARPYLEDVGEEVVYMVGAWYDMFLQNTLDTYARLEKAGKKPFLVIFPGHHGSVETGIFFSGISLPWLNYKLKGDKSLLHQSKPIKYIINPTQEWVETDSWPPKTTDINFYLQTAGSLGNSPISDNSQEIYNYIFDPSDPTPILAGNTLDDGGSVDNFAFLTERKIAKNDILLFYSPPLLEDAVITGYPKVKLWVSSSIPHADFYVRLLDHDPHKNVSMNICDGFVRLTDAKREMFEIEIALDPTAYRIQKGHAVKLIIASSAHPHYSRNPGTGVHLSIATEFLKADRQVAVSAVHASRIVLPIMPN
eukprot:Phypoly_transcript_05683.p1 GENE.Phypoly_transcript_05683~~Phypoly_transcript_05683.p1  ORF type:complete len:593 (+),score=64.07 Phypoly_transcript_05683:102-1880(+)